MCDVLLHEGWLLTELVWTFTAHAGGEMEDALSSQTHMPEATSTKPIWCVLHGPFIFLCSVVRGYSFQIKNMWLRIEQIHYEQYMVCISKFDCLRGFVLKKSKKTSWKPVVHEKKESINKLFCLGLSSWSYNVSFYEQKCAQHKFQNHSVMSCVSQMIRNGCSVLLCAALCSSQLQTLYLNVSFFVPSGDFHLSSGQKNT